MISQLTVFRPGIGVVATPALDELVQLQWGDTLRVEVSYSYRTPNEATSTFVGYLGTRDAQALSVKVPKIMQSAVDFAPGSIVIDLIPSGGILGIGKTQPGTYGLGVVVEGTDAFDEIPDCVQVSASPGIFDTISSIIPMMIMVMMMGMIMPMMSDLGD